MRFKLQDFLIIMNAGWPYRLAAGMTGWSGCANRGMHACMQASTHVTTRRRAMHQQIDDGRQMASWEMRAKPDREGLVVYALLQGSAPVCF